MVTLSRLVVVFVCSPVVDGDGGSEDDVEDSREDDGGDETVVMVVVPIELSYIVVNILVVSIVVVPAEGVVCAFVT